MPGKGAVARPPVLSLPPVLDRVRGRGLRAAPSRGCALAAVLAAALTLTGCGSPTVTPGGPTAEAAASPTPHPDGVVWAVPSAPTTLDPARAVADPVAERIAAQVYDGLVRFRPGTAQLAPGMAERWVADPRGSTFTFTLRKGMTFHDGTPIDEHAVVWNFERWMDPRHERHDGKFPGWQGLLGGFIGQKDADGHEAWLIESIEAIGPLQLRIKLRAPFAPFLHHLAMTPFGLASPAAVSAQGERYGSDAEHLPVGSGPFAVEAWEPDGSLRLRRFDRYWAGPATVPALRFVVLPDDRARVEAVAGGAAHGADLPPTTPLTDTLLTAPVEVVPRPARQTVWLMLNHGRQPLDNPKIRRAIALAIDRDRLARERFGAWSVPAGQLLPPGFLGHSPTVVVPPFDPDTARKLLAEEGVSGDFPLNIWVPTAPRPYLPDPEGTAGAVADMLKAVGINAAVRTTGARQFLNDRGTGRFTAWIIGWEAQSADPDNFWFWHFGMVGRAVAEGNYANPDLADSLREAQRVIDSEQRATIYRAAAEMVDKDSARVYLVHPQAPVVVARRLRGFRPSPLGLDDFTHVTLDPLPLGATMPPLPTAAGTPAGAEGTPPAGDGTVPADGSAPPPDPGTAAPATATGSGPP